MERRERQHEKKGETTWKEEIDNMERRDRQHGEKG